MGKIIKAKHLRDRGFSEPQIRQLCHMYGSPFYQVAKKGTWWVDEDKLDRFLDKLAKEKDRMCLYDISCRKAI